MSTDKRGSGADRLDQVVTRARRERAQRERGYREQALRMYPWVCGRCGREFSRETVHQLTVHHRDHDHDNNPPDGSNWELLCVYCHDNEHARLVDSEHADQADRAGRGGPAATHKPFAGLGALLGRAADKDAPDDD